jgi:hypothetical protein
MGNIVELRGLVKDLLNNNCIDPYDVNSTRNGNQFFDESEDLNLTRANSFPKGFIRIGNQRNNEKSPIGNTGHIKYTGRLDIFYFSKERLKYTYNGTQYVEKDIINLMIKNIRDTLLSNSLRNNGYYLTQNPFSESSQIVENPDGTFVTYYGTISVFYYWTEEY